MRLHRFYLQYDDLSGKTPGDHVAIDSFEHVEYKNLVHQWKDVFRYVAGGQMLVFDETGAEYMAMIASLDTVRAELVLLERRTGDLKSKSEQGSDSTESGERDTEIWLFASIIKNDNFDLVIQKTTELGVDHIVPILSDRTIKKNINLARAKKIAIEAAEQSGRTSVPSIYEPVSLVKALDGFVADGGMVLVCAAGGQRFERENFFKQRVATDAVKIGIVVGPEGGWSEKELAYFKQKEFMHITLGENILRAETAAIVALILIKI